MKKDISDWATARATAKLISKETLNHKGLIELVSGLDVYQNTQQAYLRSYEALGIDFINRVPLENCTKRTNNESVKHPFKPYLFTGLGVYDTAFRHTYLCNSVEELWQIDPQKLNYEDLITPVPHALIRSDIQKRQQAVEDVGHYYPMLYTTLFMWAVEFFGWETFMMAAITEPQRFHDMFLSVFAEKSRAIVAEIASSTDCPFVFVHDDLADANGPVFPPSWYNDYIFPHYPYIFEPARKLGKSIIFVADGNMEAFFPKLIDAGVDGIMFENPATEIDSVIEHFGQTGRYFIGGVDTTLLTNGSPQDVTAMVERLATKCANYKGFAICSCGGLHGNIPIENLIAYFDARVEINATPEKWKSMS